jgi:hypothetical protein
MARPNVTVIVNDDSFVISGTEAGGAHRAGYLSAVGATLIDAVGYTADRTNQFMVVDNINDWFGRLKSAAGTGYADAFTNDQAAAKGGTSGVPFAYGDTGGNQFAGGTFERWPKGPTGEWEQDWWNVHNYLQYGGVAVVFGGTGGGILPAKVKASDKLVTIDSLFGPTVHNNEIATVVALRNDCVGIVGISSGTAVSTATVVPGTSENIIHVYGEKKHRNINRVTEEFLVDSDLITSPLTCDVAGCLARTDRLAHQWFSPAGARRGQILDVVKLAKELTDSEQDTLYDAKINPVVSFAGEGTMLFGDKTGAVATSTLSRINVARLFVYLKNIIGRAARTILFELNDSTTRNLFVNAVTPVLRSIQGSRGITDFRVICDETNNTADVIDSNQFIADIFVKPTKSVNFVRIRFTNKSESADLG